ncbi:putative carboxypeptidase s1 [Phaeomoniella chlamydospora]|uniref:Putative carboxypeptidase s1 n=1 Tax=Phaeomoniella chlamydospora TaxID=158046 RepID=A0A0G2GJ73_PHACM|nr:putative carboxypeptidase s1 [Phaeomoniella chlamydospora]
MIGNVSLNPPRQYPRIAWERAQYPPSVFSDAGITTLNSPVDGNITISYKSPPVGTCTTVFSSQKQYTGYVTVPPFTLSPIQQNYTVNTFFWFIEARMSPETAPLTIYLNGGPGSSSMIGLFQEVGPCEVVEIAEGLLGTEARDWGWDRSSHVLFVDQPDQVGFSYDVLINASIDLLTSAIIEPPIALPASQHAYSFLNGTFPSGDSNNTANTTAIAAQTVWHMLQGFLGAFPQYNPGLVSNSTNAAVGINLFVESYGGKYGSAFASFWQSQNLLREQGLLSKNTTLQIDLVSLGIINGCIDDLVQGPFYPKFAYSNTYSIQALSLVDEQTAANAFLATNGCQQLIKSCRSQADSSDTDNKGDVANVNAICYQATATCASEVINVYAQSGRSYYDISQATLNPFPPNSFIEYLNQANVQSAIGVPVNFTTTSTAVTGAFNATGDYERGDYIESLAWLLSQGIRVALIYGDRDYVCNWLGGEAVSFAVAGAIQSDYSQWYNAGYAPIIVNDSYIGGVVREYGNLSFSRIYDAGHLVPAYQPETAFTVFTRVIEGTDISTGETVNLTSYYSQGDANATHTNSAPAMASPTCYLRAIDSTCSTAQKSALTNGEGVVINGIWYDKASDWTAPDSSGTLVW